MKLHICLVSEELPPETGWGGIGTYTHNLALGLREIGHKVSIISRSMGEGEKVIKSDGITIHRIKSGIEQIDDPNELNSYRFRVYKKILEIHQKQKIDIVESPEWKAETVFLLNDKNRTIPVILRLHSTFGLIKKINDIKKLRNCDFTQEIFEKYSIESADKIYSSSKSLIEIIKDDYGIRRKDMIAKFNPANTKDFSPVKKIANDIAKIKKQGLLITYVGRIEKRKGVEKIFKVIPEIIDKHKSVQFVFIGRDTNITVGRKEVSYEKYLKSKIDSKYHKNVHFLGFRPYENLPNYYPASDIAIFPSYYENFPAVCLEAMMSGCAVIGSKNGGMSEIIIDGKSGLLIDPYSSRDIKNKLELLIKNKSLRLNLGKNAHLRIKNVFDRKVIAKKTIGVYLSAIKKFKENRQSH